MNILFLTRLDPKDIHSWSGTLYHMYHELRTKHHVEIMGTEILRQIEVFAWNNLISDKFIPGDRYTESVGRILSECINAVNCDVVFFGDLLFCPHLDVNKPVVSLSDMTYEQMRLYYRKPDEQHDKYFINKERLVLNSASNVILVVS